MAVRLILVKSNTTAAAAEVLDKKQVMLASIWFDINNKTLGLIAEILHGVFVFR